MVVVAREVRAGTEGRRPYYDRTRIELDELDRQLELFFGSRCDQGYALGLPLTDRDGICLNTGVTLRAQWFRVVNALQLDDTKAVEAAVWAGNR